MVVLRYKAAMLLVALMLAARFVGPGNKNLVYVGRWDRSDSTGAACEWPASEVSLQIARCRRLTVTLADVGAYAKAVPHDLWQVTINGKPTQVLALSSGEREYDIALPNASSGPVDVQLVKRTEAFVGKTVFKGFQLDAGMVLKARRASRHLEFVGDSITCGYGNEGKSQLEHFRPETENAYMSYAEIAARAVHADATIVAWSGRKMWPDDTMPSIYNLVLPAQPGPVWRFDGPPPAAVIINLGTNDFGRGNPNEAKWSAAYEAFIRSVWRNYPRALVYCATGSMMSDTYPPGQNALSTLTSYLQRMISRMNDKRLRLIAFDPQRMENGLGADWHPSVKTDGLMGDQLVASIRRDLGW